MKYEISFIITSRNESNSTLNSTINGLMQTTAGHKKEIIVIDDSSNSPAICPCQEVLLVRNRKPMGVSWSRRYGSLLASGNVLVWMDAHMNFTTGWLDKMLSYVESKAMLCPTVFNHDYSSRPAYGAKLSWSSERDYYKRKCPGFKRHYLLNFPGHAAVDVPMLNPACYVMLKESYWKTGGFSPFLRVWGATEQDISLRAWITGFGVKCVTDVKIGHLFRPKHPYPVLWDYLEYNQLIIIRTVFEEHTVQVLEEFLKPIPEQVQKWTQKVNLYGWRTAVQSNRRLSDVEFFRRFIPEVLDLL
ncbi:MAG: glycosyltransferase [Planctomycetota bacterium]